MFEIMATQHGLITRAQATEAGLSAKQIRRLLGRGEWCEVERNVFRSAAVPPTWESNLLAACLTSGGVASHRCAAALWGLDGWWSPPVEISVPRGSAARSLDHRVHQTTQWDRIDLVRRRNIPCTGIDRTLMDLAAKISLRRTELAVESALRKELTTWPALRRCLIRGARRGRDGCGRLRAFLELRYGDDELPLSEWSRLVANILQDGGLPAAALEHPVYDRAGALVTVLDLAWPQQRVALELDSVRWHLNRSSFEHDRRKRNRARLLGWTIHEATWAMTIDDASGLVQLMRAALAPPEPNWAG